MGNLVLGIETSCDDTSVALVDMQGNVAAIETVSQYEIHSEFGGVYPELASRAHLEAILPMIEKVMAKAEVTPIDLRAIGVTRGPGLMGSLLVGLSTAQALSMAWNIPTYGVNHLRGHIRSVDLEEKRLAYPALVLLVSGGHTLLAYLKNQYSYELLGITRDDSVGECYDKVARTLGLGMPGGPAIDRMAAAGTANIKFPRPMIKSGYEFSFSGLKSSVARYVETHAEFDVNDVAAAFVDAVNTFHGYPDTPIGVVRNGSTPEPEKYNLLADEKNADGSFRYPHDLLSGTDAPEAVGLLRQLLAKQPDQSITLAQVGFFTNFSPFYPSWLGHFRP